MAKVKFVVTCPRSATSATFVVGATFMVANGN